MVTRFRAIDLINQSTGKTSTGLEFTTVKKLSLIEQLEQNDNFIAPFEADFRTGGFEAFDDDRAARVDFPWSMWAMMAKLRIWAGSVMAGWL